MNWYLRIAATITLAVTISGCAVFHPQEHLAKLRAQQAARDLAYDGAFEFEAGRGALLEESYGRAIILLRKAELYPAYRGEAANGLGIAYAALGREDIAQHYFAKAVAIAPNQQKYLANLERIEASLNAVSLQMANQGKTTPIKQATRHPAALTASITANGLTVLTSADGGQSALVRTSPMEVQLVEARPARQASQRKLALSDVSRISGQ